MTNPDSGFWQSARAPRNPAEAAQRARRAANTPAPPEPASDINAATAIETVASMDQATYAANRDQLLGGPRPSSEFVGIDRPAGRAGLMLSADEVHALLPHRTVGDRPTSGRVLDRSYQEAAQHAAANTSLALPTRYTRNPESI